MIQIQSPHLRPVTTAHLAQTMTLLNQTVDELYEQIQRELANPALELVEERRCPTCHRVLPNTGSCPVCSLPTSMEGEEPVVFVSPREDFYPSSGASAENIPDEPLSPMVEDLPTFVLRQNAADLAPEQRKKLPRTCLPPGRDDGFLTIPLVDVARYSQFCRQEVEAGRNHPARGQPSASAHTTRRKRCWCSGCPQ